MTVFVVYFYSVNEEYGSSGVDSVWLTPKEATARVDSIRNDGLGHYGSSYDYEAKEVGIVS